MKQTTEYSCLAACAAIVLGWPIESVYRGCGHDGSEISFPELPEPLNRRGFHIHEIIDLAYRNGYAVTLIEANPQRITNIEKYLKGFPGDPLYVHPDVRLKQYLLDSKGILTGQGIKAPHAIVYDHGLAIDPKVGRPCRLDEIKDFTIEVYWIFNRRYGFD